MNRNNLSFRKVINTGQFLKLNYLILIDKFLSNVMNERKKYDYKNEIINVYEDPMYLNLTTIEVIGRKSIPIKTSNQEKFRISLVLKILANGHRLPPLLIFKVKSKKKVEKRLQQLPMVRLNKKNLIYQKNAWDDAFSMNRYINKICYLIKSLIKYLKLY